MSVRQSPEVFYAIDRISPQKRLPMSRQAARWIDGIAPMLLPFDRAKPAVYLDIVLLREIGELTREDRHRIMHAIKKMDFGYAVALPLDPSPANGFKTSMTFTIPMACKKMRARAGESFRYRLKLAPLVVDRGTEGCTEHVMAFLSLSDRNLAYGRHYLNEVEELRLSHPADPEGTGPLRYHNGSYEPLHETSIIGLIGLLPDAGPTTLDVDAFDFDLGTEAATAAEEQEIVLDGNDLEVVEELMLISPQRPRRLPPPPPSRRAARETTPYSEYSVGRTA